MTTILALIVVLSLMLSFVCSVMEAALLTVPLAYVRHLSNSGSRAGRILAEFKEDIRKPIAAILLLNTISHTLGAAVGGALVGRLFGDDMVLVFSAVFTLMLLYFAEIPPKELGVIYSRQASVIIAFPLKVMIYLMYPFIYISEFVARFVGKDFDQPSVSLAEVLSIAAIGSEEGVLDKLEGSVIHNVIGLDKRLVKDILTPRVVVSRLAEETKVGELETDVLSWSHSRIPVHPEEEPDKVDRYVLQRDVLRALVRGQKDLALRDLSRPLNSVSELMKTDQLLLQMFEKREQICAVYDEHGGFAGIVTLEDIIEEIVGREILDESDLVGDMRSHAKKLFKKRRAV
jgi:CBS domain containing-hemolysin-like protein